MNIYKKLIEDKSNDHGITCVKTLISKHKLINMFRNKECLVAILGQLIDYVSYKGNFHQKICRKCAAKTSLRPPFNFDN